MADEGATPRELILEASRRNNTDLLQEVFTTLGSGSNSKPHPVDTNTDEALSPSEVEIANLINTARDGIGQASLHIASFAGSLDVLDALLDQPGVETDPLDRREGETPLHKAVQYCNSLELHVPGTNGAGGLATDEFLEANEGHAVVHMLVDAGCDPRIRNKGKVRPVDQVDPRNTLLRDFLRRAEMALDLGDDVVDDDEESEGGSGPPSDEE